MGRRSGIIKIENKTQLTQALIAEATALDILGYAAGPEIDYAFKYKNKHYLVVWSDGNEAMEYFHLFGLYPIDPDYLPLEFPDGENYRIKGAEYMNEFEFEKSLGGK